jgi:hypothetical protein
VLPCGVAPSAAHLHVDAEVLDLQDGGFTDELAEAQVQRAQVGARLGEVQEGCGRERDANGRSFRGCSDHSQSGGSNARSSQVKSTRIKVPSGVRGAAAAYSRR